MAGIRDDTQSVAILRDFPKILYRNAGECATHTSFNSVTLETSRFEDELKESLSKDVFVQQTSFGSGL